MTALSTSLPSLEGRRYLITGASAGLGKETARVLAAHGASLVLLVRDRRRGDAVRAEFVAAGARGAIDVVVVDLADLASVAAGAAAVDGEFDAFVNNAGVGTGVGVGVDGVDVIHAANHLGHFALNARLFTRLKPHGRIVAVTSGFIRRRGAAVDFEDLTRGARADLARYTSSKVANALYVRALVPRLAQSPRRDVVAVLAHPGFTATGMQDQAPRWARPLVKVVTSLFALPVEQGARPQIFAAAGAGVQAGHLYGPRDGAVVDDDLGAAAVDDDAAARLWTLSEQQSGLRFPLSADGATAPP